MKRSWSDIFFSLSLLVVFVICSVCLLFYQIQGYEHLRETATSSEEQNLPVAYLRTIFHQRKQNSIFTKTSLEDIACLRVDDLVENTSTYIYAYDGYLRELYVSKDSIVHAKDGDALAPLDAFEIEQQDHSYTFVLKYQESSISLLLSTY